MVTDYTVEVCAECLHDVADHDADGCADCPCRLDPDPYDPQAA